MNISIVSYFCLRARVILACRDLTGAYIAADEIQQQSGNGNVAVKKNTGPRLAAVCQRSGQRCPGERLDILINNAGVFFLVILPYSVSSSENQSYIDASLICRPHQGLERFFKQHVTADVGSKLS